MNSEHYQDPTAEKAISRVEKKRQEKRNAGIVYAGCC